MAKEKKKQHFVPRSYLERWAIPGKYQVYVYNKQQKKSYPASIYDVASERYFYDIDFTGIFTEEDLRKFGFSQCDPKHADDEQYIENLFADEVEDDFKNRFGRIINRVYKMSPWEIKHCYFLSEVDKFHLSFHLALQYIRVKSIRNNIVDSNDCLMQVLEDMGASEKTIDRYTVPKSQLPYIHGKLILNGEEINNLSQSFFSLTWILQVNRTSHPFYTSDSPIGTEEHLHHPCVSMAGLRSRGVEVYFPISPQLMLLMFDGEYHVEFQEHDRRVIELDNPQVVKYCNSRCILHSDSCIFSNNNDFSVINEMIAKNPNVLNQPRTVLHWGGKTYIPRRNKQGQ